MVTATMGTKSTAKAYEIVSFKFQGGTYVATDKRTARRCALPR